MRKILVIGTAHHNTLGMIRCLGIAGYRIDLVLIGGAKKFLTHSRYLNNVHLLDDLNDLMDYLTVNCTKILERPIIICCSDAVASYLDTKYDEIKGKYYFFNSGKANKLTTCMDKQYQVSLANKLGIKVPISYIYRGNISNTIYPSLLKPAQSINGGKQVIICYNKEELINGLSSFDKSVDILVQQFIEKEYEIVILGVSVNGQIIIPGYILKHREFDGGTLYSTVKPIASLPDSLISACKDMVREMNYEGLFGMEFIYRDGQYYFIECNLRNDATTYALTVAGVNLPELYVKAKKENVILPVTYSVKEIQSIVEFNDFKHRKDFGVSLFQWLKEYFSASCKYYFNRKDPMPFFYAPFK